MMLYKPTGFVGGYQLKRVLQLTSNLVILAIDLIGMPDVQSALHLIDIETGSLLLEERFDRKILALQHLLGKNVVCVGFSSDHYSHA